MQVENVRKQWYLLRRRAVPPVFINTKTTNASVLDSTVQNIVSRNVLCGLSVKKERKYERLFLLKFVVTFYDIKKRANKNVTKRRNFYFTRKFPRKKLGALAHIFLSSIATVLFEARASATAYPRLFQEMLLRSCIFAIAIFSTVYCTSWSLQLQYLIFLRESIFAIADFFFQQFITFSSTIAQPFHICRYWSVYRIFKTCNHHPKWPVWVLKYAIGTELRNHHARPRGPRACHLRHGPYAHLTPSRISHCQVT
jgi:hypothetical protein